MDSAVARRSDLTLESTPRNPVLSSASVGPPIWAVAELLMWNLICFAASGVGVLAVNQTLDSWYVAVQTLLESPELGFRAGLDHTLHDDGGLGLVDVEAPR